MATKQVVYDAMNKAIDTAGNGCKLNYLRARAENLRILGHISKDELRELKKKITQKKRTVPKTGPDCDKEM